MKTPQIRNFSYTSFTAMMPYLKKEKTKTYTSLVFSLIAIMFFGLFAINPTLSTIASLQKQIEDSQQVYEKLQQKITNLNQLRNQYQQIKPDLFYVDDALPKEPFVALLTAQIHGAANANNVAILRLQVQQIELANKSALVGKPSQLGPNQHNAFSLSFDAAGSYDSVISFVNLLGNFQRILTIESLTIGLGQDTSQPFSLSVRARTYYKN